MKKRVLCVEQHLRRGVNTNALIATYLEKAEIQARLSLTGAQLCYNLLQFEPHVVYYPWLTESILHFLRRREPNVPIVNAFQEQNSVLHSPESYMVRWSGKADYIFAWGKVHKERFEELFDDTTVCLTGNPRFDPYFDTSIAEALYPTRDELANQYSLQVEKSWVLLALDFPLLFTKEDRIKELIEENCLEQSKVNTIEEIYNRLSGWVRKYAEYDQGPTLIIRPHPGSNIEKIRKDFGGKAESVRYIKGGDLPPWIIAAERYISRASTSIIEAWLANTPTALIQKDKSIKNGDNRPHVLEADRSLETYAEFEEFVRTKGDNEVRNRHHDFLDRHHQLDGRSAYRTAMMLHEIVARQENGTDYTKQFAEDFTERLKYLIKKIINEYGLNKWNPFDRPNNEFLSQREARKKIDIISSQIKFKNNGIKCKQISSRECD